MYEEFGFIGNPFPPFGTQKIGRINDRIIKVKPVGVEEEIKYVENWLAEQIKSGIEKPEFLWIVGYFGFGKSTLLQYFEDRIENGEFGNCASIHKELTYLPTIDEIVDETYEKYEDNDRIIIIIEEGQENIRDLTGSKENDVKKFTRSLRRFRDISDERMTKYSVILAITTDSELELHNRYDISTGFLRNRVELEVFDLFMAEEIVKQLLRNAINENSEEKLNKNPFYPFSGDIFPLVYVLVPYVEKKLLKSTVGPNSRTFNHIMSELFEIAVKEKSEMTLEFLKQLLKERKLKIGGESIDAPKEDKLRDLHAAIELKDPYILDIADYIAFSPWWKTIEEIKYGTSKNEGDVSTVLSLMQSFGFLEERKGLCIKEKEFNSMKESLLKEFAYYSGIIEELPTDKTSSYRISKNGDCWRTIFLTPRIPREIIERLREVGEEIELYRLSEDFMHSLYLWVEEKKIPTKYGDVWSDYLQKDNMEKGKIVMANIANLLKKSGFFSKIHKNGDHLSFLYSPLQGTELFFSIAVYRFLSLGEETLEQKIEKIVEDFNPDVSDYNFAIVLVNPPYRRELPSKEGNMIRGMPESSRIYIVDVTDEKLVFLLGEGREGMELMEGEVKKAQRAFVKSALENYALIPVFGVDIGRPERKAEFKEILIDNWWYKAHKWLTQALDREKLSFSNLQISDHYSDELEILNKTKEYSDEDNLFIKSGEVLVSPYEKKVLELVKNSPLKRDQLKLILRGYFVAEASNLEPENLIDLLIGKHLFGKEEGKIFVLKPSNLILSLENKLEDCGAGIEKIKEEPLDFFKDHLEITNEKWLERFRGSIQVKNRDFEILKAKGHEIKEDDWENIGIFNTALSIFEEEVESLLEDVGTAQTKFEKQLKELKTNLDDFTRKGDVKTKKLKEVTSLDLSDIKGLKVVADDFTSALKRLCEFINIGAASEEEIFDREFNKLREASNKINDTIDKVIAKHQEGEEIIEKYSLSFDEFDQFKDSLAEIKGIEDVFIESLPACENDVKQIYNLYRDIKKYPHPPIPPFGVEKERIRGLLRYCSLNAAAYHLDSLKKFRDIFNPLTKKEEFKGSIENLRERIKKMKGWFETRGEQSIFTRDIISCLSNVLEKRDVELYVSYVNYIKSSEKRKSLFLCHHLAIENYSSFAVNEKIGEFSQILNISKEDVKNVLEYLEVEKILKRAYKC